MKKIIIFTLLTAIFLSGCFGFLKRNRPAAEETAPAQQEEASASISQNSQAQIPEPPSFQDGDYYLQALGARDIKLCAKISNEKLKSRCETKVENSTN